jgi:hypothetical protein
MCRAERIKRAVVSFGIFGLLITSACYQQFERLNVKATDEGIIFSHPKMDEALRQGNLCAFGEINVTRQTNDYSEQMWTAQSIEPTFQPFNEPLKECRIVYGEVIPQTSVRIDPKPLREGNYKVKGVVIIHNQKGETLKDLSFWNEFTLTKDQAGDLTVLQTTEK